MTLITGTKPTGFLSRIIRRRGFTFIEVMVTLIILASGITMIFKTYFIALDQMTYLTTRLYALMILDNRVSQIERTLRAYKTLPVQLEKMDSVDMGNQQVDFKESMSISAVDEYVEIFKLDLSIAWKQGSREIALSRSSYLSDFGAL